jgi:hypothetical protein
MFILIYGDDGCGKSVQARSVAETGDNPVHLSFAVKNRKLYEGSTIESIECLSFNPDATINPYKTIDAYHDNISKIITDNVARVVVIDEITFLRTWAQPVVLEEINRSRRGTTKPLLTKIGEQNLAGWSRVNQIVYSELERLSNWAEVNDAIIIAITSVSEKRKLVQDNDGETHSVTTGEMVCNAKDNIRKLADVRIRLEKDGSRGKGYWAFWEKYQDWMQGGTDIKKVEKDGVMQELMLRGVI